MKFRCPKCGGENVFFESFSIKGFYICPDCEAKLRKEEVVEIPDGSIRREFFAYTVPQNPGGSAQCVKCACGSWQPQGTVVCSNCGATLVYVKSNPMPQQSSNGLGVASLFCGVCSLLSFVFIAFFAAYLCGIVTGLAAFICGVISLYNKPAGRNGTAVAGIVLGLIGFAGWILLLALSELISGWL